MINQPAETASKEGGGALILVVGQSGVGKDTLLRGAREALADDTRFVFPRRFITRLPDPSEDHVSVSTTEFAAMFAQGDFALVWHAHGLSYALGRSVVEDVAAGFVVVCNVSRTIVANARQNFPNVLTVEIVATRGNRIARLAVRGREASSEIAARVDRQVESRFASGEAGHHVTIDNNGNPIDGIAAFVAVLKSMAITCKMTTC